MASKFIICIFSSLVRVDLDSNLQIISLTTACLLSDMKTEPMSYVYVYLVLYGKF